MPYAAADISLAPAIITRAGLLPPAEIAEGVHRWGIVVFPGLLEGELLARLNHEFDVMIAARRDLGVPVDEADNVINIRFTREFMAEALPMTAAFYGSQAMADTARCFFRGQPHRLNDEVFATVLTQTTKAQDEVPFALHFDKRQVLKFFLYLTDTDASNGAMRALPGSNLHNRLVRERAAAAGTVDAIANVVPEPQTPSIPICGRAGTLLIFDTDMCHGAGSVAPGRVRRTLRGHTHSEAVLQEMERSKKRTM